ncbi:DNA segregation ATPase%2C FtsK/SpoIIIE family [Mycobacteroides abscessus]|uniref:FtsK/SpoIIIE domain-containing protein n=1 Tax=Mycobacteroides abscessus TaxID=36809 RepID=UPI0005DFF0B7|nr:FtsK/SpoIIIE domain-containing protein [Mycobacteroides abscessus]CPX20641.1 DNA segregation ATPase%2C FtsK/SpoIIIE family [Mycobacteroides abscessus]CRG61233.1 DNA segregation ATPase%2C FtsK/SpoIIIE family [Mycobacteroides abscessus]
MGLFGAPEYVPNEREKWQMRQADAKEERRRWEREQAAARKLQDEARREVEREEERAQADLEKLIKEQKRAMRDTERELLTKPLHTTRGGSAAIKDAPIIVWHWAIPLPPGRNRTIHGVKRKDAGPLVALWHGGGIGEDDVIPVQLAQGSSGQDMRHWWKRASEVLEQVEKRYPILADLRDDKALERLLRPVGVLRTFDDTMTERGVVPAEDGSPIEYKRPVTITELPTIQGVEIRPDGLRITFAYREGETAKRWLGKLAELRVAFNANGVHNANNLRIMDGQDGELILDFDDAPSSFPAAVAPVAPTTTPQTIDEAIERYDRSRWMLGLDARGQVVSFPILSQPHVLVTGATSAGKSVWARTLIESLRTGYRDVDAASGKGQDAGGGWLTFLSDGKGSDMTALIHQPGIAMVVPGTDPAQVSAMVRRIRIEVERRFELAGKRKMRGESDPFRGMQPWLMLLDEWGTTFMSIKQDFGKASEEFLTDIDKILRLGRECRVHCVLLSQTIRKTGEGAVPGSWQENLGLTVSLGAPSDITLQSDAFTPATRERAAFIGSRLKGKRGRGLTVDRENETVVEVQSFYGWSPGTTSLDPDAPSNVRPPTPEVRKAWEQWEPVCEDIPWLAPRVGIRVEDGTWRESSEDVYRAQLVPITDRHGNLLPGAERDDPSSESWTGAKGVGGGGSGSPIADFGFVDDDNDGVDDREQPTDDARPTVKAERESEGRDTDEATETEPAAPPATNVQTEEQLSEWIAANTVDTPEGGWD